MVAARAEDPDPVLPHGRQVRSTGDQMDIGAGAVERGTDIGADRTGAEDCDSHTGKLRSVEGTEELSNVDEILSTVGELRRQGR